jgi:outer membrane protein assembly factor BamB
MASRRVVLFVILILTAFSGSIPSCKPSGPSTRFAVSAVPESDLGIPPLRYQKGVDVYNRAQVPIPSPTAKPKVIWKKALDLDDDILTAFTDSKGGTIYPLGKFPLMADTIVHLLPDGTENWRVKLDPPIDAKAIDLRPVVITDGGVVVMLVSYTDDDFFISLNDDPDWGWAQNNLPHPSQRIKKPRGFLVYIDLDGKVRWSTDTYEMMPFVHYAWRMSGNRVAMFTLDSKLSIFSLSDGEFLESITIPGLSSNMTAGPIPMDDGSFIFYGQSTSSVTNGPAFVTRMASDGSKVWLQDFAQDGGFISYAPTLSSSGILGVGLANRFLGLDVVTGNTLWERDKGIMCRVLGSDFDGNFLCGIAGSRGPMKIELVNPSGKVKWLHSPSSDFLGRESSVIIYKDNNILIGCEQGFSLISYVGTVMWTVTGADLGLSGSHKFDYWKFNPCPDGTLVVYVFDYAEKKPDYIFGMK